MSSKSRKPKANEDSQGRPIYLRVLETRDGEYFHLRANLVVQRYEDYEHLPNGVDDDYSSGLLWSGLRVGCQGDERSRLRAAGQGEQGAVYGFGVEYKDVFSVDLRKARRMLKTLEKVEKGMGKLTEARGYVRSYGEYLGRVAEVFGCAGMVFARPARGRHEGQDRWIWTSVGEGVNRADRLIAAWSEQVLEADARHDEDARRDEAPGAAGSESEAAAPAAGEEPAS